MQEHIRQIDRESKQLSNAGLPAADGMQPFTRGSQKVIEAVMESAAKGKVMSFCMVLLDNLYLSFNLNDFVFLKEFLCISFFYTTFYSGSNHTTRLSFKTFFKPKR